MKEIMRICGLDVEVETIIDNETREELDEFFRKESEDKYICDNCMECRSAKKHNIFEIDNGEYVCQRCYESFIGG